MNKLVLRNLTLIIFCLVSANVSAQDIWDGTTASSFYGGSGTESDPYQIRTGAELMYFVSLVNAGDDFNGKFVKMMNDIDLNDNNFNVSQFAGTFDGNGHFITVLFGASTNSPLFGSVSGRIHHLGVTSTIKSQYKGVSYCQITLVNVLQESGIIEDCYYIVNGGAELFYYQEAYARNNYGTIRNCYAGGSFRIYGETTGTVACQLVYQNYSSGVIENCFASVNNGKTSQYYGGRDIPMAYYDYGTTIHNSNDIDSLNLWVDEHPEHSRWTNSGQYKLVDFNPALECTIEFVDTLFHNSIPSIIRANGEPIGVLPDPVADCTFVGWNRLGNIVKPEDIVNGDWMLFAKWQQNIRRQPTFDNMSIEVDDIEHASFNWYAVYGEAIHWADWTSPCIGHGRDTSYVISAQAIAGQTLQFDYKVSSEAVADEFIFYSNGTVLFRASGEMSESFTYTIPADGMYRFTFRYSKDDDTNQGSDNVIITNIRLSNPENLLDCTSPQLPDYLITQNGLYFCKVNYSNTVTVLTSDTVCVNEPYLDNIIEINNVVAHTGTLQTMPVNLVNHDSIVGVEFDLLLPEGVILEDKCLGERSETHQRTTELTDNGAWHFSIQSSDGASFDGNEGNILYLVLKIGDDVAFSDYMVTLTNIKLMTQGETLIRPKDVIARLTISPAGDVDGNGIINISDVTNLIDYLLTR